MLAHRFIVLALTFVITLFFGFICAQLPVMSTLQDFLDPNGEGMVQWEDARDRFGGDESLFLAVKSKTHFTAAGLERMQTVVEKIEAHPFVERIVTFTTAQELRIDPEDPDSIIIEPYVRDGVSPGSIKKSMLADEGLAGQLLSKDGSGVILLVQLVANSNEVAEQPIVRAEILRRIDGRRALASQLEFADGPRRVLEISKATVGAELVQILVDAGYDASGIHAGGFSMLIGAMLESADRNLAFLFPITVLILLLILLILFRRFSEAVLPLICVAPAVIWSVGIGGMVFGRLTIVTSMVPVMVLVVGISDVVHLVTQYRHELARGHTRDDAILISFRDVGAACALTSLTTFVGFGSMIFLPLPYARELGVFAGLGVVTAFVVSFLLTPILLSFANISAAEKKPKKPDLLLRFLTQINTWLIPHPKRVLSFGVVASVLLGLALTQVQVENSLTRKLDKDHPLRRSAEILDTEYGGSGDIAILIDSKSPDGLLDPRILGAMDNLSRWIDEHEPGCSTFSLVDVMASMQSVMTPDAPRRMPQTREAVAQYLLLFEMSGGEALESLIDDTRQHARITVRMKDQTAEAVVAMANRIQAQADRFFPPDVYVAPNGIGLQAARLSPVLLTNALQGFSGAILLIAILMGILYRTVRVAVLCLLPNIVPVAVGVLAAYVFMEQFDADGLSYISICIGVAVDDTIHLLSRYRLERQRGRDRDSAVRATVLESGHGIIRTSVILMSGFSVMWFSDYQPVKTLGLMLPATMLAAVFLDLTVVPAMAQLGLLEPKIDSVHSGEQQTDS